MPYLWMPYFVRFVGWADADFLLMLCWRVAVECLHRITHEDMLIIVIPIENCQFVRCLLFGDDGSGMANRLTCFLCKCDRNLVNKCHFIVNCYSNIACVCVCYFKQQIHLLTETEIWLHHICRSRCPDHIFRRRRVPFFESMISFGYGNKSGFWKW